MILACLIAAIPTAGVHPAVVARAAERAAFVASVWPADVVPESCEFARRIWAESSYRPHVVGADGERGLTQVLPKTGRSMCRGLKWRTDPTDNLRCGHRVWSRYGRSHRVYTHGPGRRART